MLIESKHASKSTRILRVYPQSLLIRVKKRNHEINLFQSGFYLI